MVPNLTKAASFHTNNKTDFDFRAEVQDNVNS